MMSFASGVVLVVAIAMASGQDNSHYHRQCGEDSTGIPPDSAGYNVFRSLNCTDVRVRTAMNVASLSWRTLYGATTNPTGSLAPVMLFQNVNFQGQKLCCRSMVSFPTTEKPFVNNLCCDWDDCSGISKLNTVFPCGHARNF